MSSVELVELAFCIYKEDMIIKNEGIAVATKTCPKNREASLRGTVVGNPITIDSTEPENTIDPEDAEVGIVKGDSRVDLTTDAEDVVEVWHGDCCQHSTGRFGATTMEDRS